MKNKHVNAIIVGAGAGGGVVAKERTFSLGTRGKSIKLTEFPDPEGKVVYFRIPDFSVSVQDEILSGNNFKC